MSLTTRIESLENQFFPPRPKNSIYWPEFLFIYYLDVRYGSENVEKNISGIKLYKFKLLKDRYLRFCSSTKEAGAAPATTPKSTAPPKTIPKMSLKEKKARKLPDSVLR